MSVELHLPDLPDVPIAIGSARPPARRRSWHEVLRESFSSYLPLLLMAVLALGTWWLVKNTPILGAPSGRDALRDEPDYTMQTFSVQRFAPDGRLRVRLEGRELRHYPADDRIEVDSVMLHAIAPDGRVTVASARRAVSNGAANWFELQGGAEVTGTDANGAPVVIRSEYLQALLDSDVIRSDRPVQVLQGRNVLRAGGVVYDHGRRTLELSGPVRAVLQVRGP